MSKITLYGLAQYDNTLFDNLSVPTGIDRNTLIDNILIKGAEFEVLYSDPIFMKSAIDVWSKKWNRTFTKWIDALNVEYNPLENYDRLEEWEDTSNGTSRDTSSINSGSENKVSAFNSSTYEPDNSTSSNTASTGLTELNNVGTRKGRAHGNIGVTTSQQMLQSELDIALWNIYEHITDIFLEEFIIPIY